MKAVLQEYRITQDKVGSAEITISLKSFNDLNEIIDFLNFIRDRENLFSDETLSQYLMTRKWRK